MGEPWKKRGCIVNFFLLQTGCGWVVDEYFQLSWLCVSSLDTCAWFPLRRVVSVEYCNPLSRHCWLALVSGRETSLAVLVMILLDTEMSNNNRNHQMGLCRNNQVFGQKVMDLPSPTMYVICLFLTSRSLFWQCETVGILWNSVTEVPCTISIL